MWKSWLPIRAKGKSRTEPDEDKTKSKFESLFSFGKVGKLGRPSKCISDALYDSKTGYFIVAYGCGLIQWNVASFSPNPTFTLICEWDLSEVLKSNSIKGYAGLINSLQLSFDPKPYLFCLIAGKIIFRAALSSSMNQFDCFEDCSKTNFTWHIMDHKVSFLKAIASSWLWVGTMDGKASIFNWSTKSNFGSYCVEYEANSLWKENPGVYKLECPDSSSLLIIYENGCSTWASMDSKEELRTSCFKSSNSMDLLVACSNIHFNHWLTATQTGTICLWNRDMDTFMPFLKCLRVLDLKLSGNSVKSKEYQCIILGQINTEITGISFISFGSSKGAVKFISNDFYPIDNPCLDRLFSYKDQSFWAIGSHTDEMWYLNALEDGSISSGIQESWSFQSKENGEISFATVMNGSIVIVIDNAINVYSGRVFDWVKVNSHLSPSQIKDVAVDADSSILIYITDKGLGILNFEDGLENPAIERFEEIPSEMMKIETPQIYFFALFQMIIVSVCDGSFVSDYHENPFQFKRIMCSRSGEGEVENREQLDFCGVIDCQLFLQSTKGTLKALNVMEGLKFMIVAEIDLAQKVMLVDRGNPSEIDLIKIVTTEKIFEWNVTNGKLSDLQVFSEKLRAARSIYLGDNHFLITLQDTAISLYEFSTFLKVKTFDVVPFTKPFSLESNGTFFAQNQWNELCIWTIFMEGKNRTVTISIPEDLEVSHPENANRGIVDLVSNMMSRSKEKGLEWREFFDKKSESVQESRNANDASNSTTAVLADTAIALAERGERLQNVEQKTSELSNQAQDFLSLAKEINKREKNRWI